MHSIQMADATNAALHLNEPYTFASAHAFALYPLRAVYTFIPKNACSTMRFSVAVANGFLTEQSDVNWIHANNGAFVATQEFVASCDYAFVVLRCPFRRVASAYLDKIVGGERHLKGLIPTPVRQMYRAFGRRSLARKVQSLSFEDFLERLAGQDRADMDSHWRPQSDFLLFREYDDYFAMERFDQAQQALEQRGLRVIDTRTKLNHDTSALTRVTGDFARVPGHEIFEEKAQGRIPDARSLYSDRALSLARQIYARDIEIYRDRFGPEGLLFS